MEETKTGDESRVVNRDAVLGREYIGKHPDDPWAYRDVLAIYREHMGKDDETVYHQENRWLRKQMGLANQRIGSAGVVPTLFGSTDTVRKLERMNEVYRQSLLMDAKVDFDAYCRYIEADREPRKQFYLPRRKKLAPVVNAMQRLMDDQLDLLGISLPPGVGKSTLSIFYLTWVAGKYPDEPNLTGSHSNAFVKGAYEECLRILDPNGEYLWKDVFPGLGVTNTNAKDCRIDIGNRKRFETLEFTSIGSGNAGLYRAGRLLYCDDLISGIEIALSKERLDKLWETYTTDLRQRKIGNHCKELHVATRWSVHDVLGRLERQYEGSERVEFIALPALDENDESNFDYPYGVGFSTEFYHEQRDIMDDANWKALYQNEPIEREGQLYHPDELRRFFEMPDTEPDAIIAICDTKNKGSDYAFMPIAKIYGNDWFIVDCICDNGDPGVIEDRISWALVKNKVQIAEFESNSAGWHIAEKIQDKAKAMGGFVKLTTRYTTQNKETKIIVNAPAVKEHCLFLDSSKYKPNTDYGRMMSFLTGYTMAGRNKHDDVPDGMAMLALYMENKFMKKVVPMARPF